jgi:hypothetical protein
VAIAATIEGDALVTALIALLDMTAECSGEAEFDSGHDATLCRAQRRAMLLAIRVGVVAEHVHPATMKYIHQARSEGWNLPTRLVPGIIGPRNGL